MSRRNKLAASADLAGHLATIVARTPDRMATEATDALEDSLASWAGVPYAIAVASGTAALHTALVAAGVGPGDEVLVPAVSVVMSAAPIVYVGARPVFVECVEGGFELDYADLAGKLTSGTRAVLPVHLWGRACGEPQRLREFAAENGLVVIEDACQAHGTRIGRELLGTTGDVGCFSLKSGKLLSCGEGGFLLTRDQRIAARARAFRTHWQTPPEGEVPLSRLGHNYRLAEPLAAIASWHLDRFDQRLAVRMGQALMLAALLSGVAGLDPIRPRDDEDWNAFSPLFRVLLPSPREFCEHLASQGVPNSVGTFRLVAGHQRQMFAPAARCPAAEAVIDTTLAIVLSEHDNEAHIRRLAGIVAREAHRWTSH